jgi:hypothetical protein
MYQEQDRVLKPYIAVLVRGCIRNASMSTAPYHHLAILRVLFRGVLVRKTEALNDEFPPLLPYIIEV